MKIKYFLLGIAAILNFCVVSASAQEIAGHAEAFGTLPEISNIKLSPDGTRLLMLQNVNGQIMIVTRSLENLSEPWNAMPSAGNLYDWAAWLSNDEILIGSSHTSETGRGKYLRSTKGMSIVDWKGEVANSLSDILDFELVSILKDDPDHILVQGGEKHNGWIAVYKYNIRTNKMDKYHNSMRTINN